MRERLYFREFGECMNGEHVFWESKGKEGFNGRG